MGFKSVEFLKWFKINRSLCDTVIQPHTNTCSRRQTSKSSQNLHFTACHNTSSSKDYQTRTIKYSQKQAFLDDTFLIKNVGKRLETKI